MSEYYGGPYQDPNHPSSPEGEGHSPSQGWNQSSPSFPRQTPNDSNREDFFCRYGSIFDEPGSGKTPPPPKPPKKQRSHGNASMALLVAGCMVFSALTGFAGGYGAFKLMSGQNGGTVLYQAPATNLSTTTGSGEVGNLSDIAKTATPSVVEITTEALTTNTFFGQQILSGAGSGVIISQDGYIVTNDHVVSGANKITVRLSDGTSYDAQLIGTDPQTDIAVVKIQASGLTPAVLGDSDTLAVGDLAVAIGNPLGELGGTVTNGIISALARQVTVEGKSMTLLQTNAAINPGNSGGGLFNARAELVGIVNAKSSGNGVEGLGFAIPINAAKPIIEDLIDNGFVTGRPSLGVSLIDISDARTAMSYGVQYLGVYVQGVTEGSAAEKAGLQVGDCILAANDQQVSTSQELASLIGSMSAGDTLKLQILRDGMAQDLTATLQESSPSKA